MFRRILIANRGEIACRVIRTARAMGLETVAVYSDADRDAHHVEMADEAVRLGAAQPSESYLRIERIVEAALKTHAQAIHPGYGFLSENPGFVEAVEGAGLVFVGPSAAAIRAMGLKDAAKRLMAEAGVPVVPGYDGADQEPGHLEVEAREIGYPVLIKAVAGGGGKGMRKVERPEDFLEKLESAKREALGAFGNDAVLIERLVEKPRHIEVQVFGDGARAVHLFERDCSLQRRHQKVIEEAPAPAMTGEMRAAMGAAAVRAAEAIGYRGAGTVEFIADASEGLRPDRFYFMEMNTRLQVEHPVTEAVTGVDLVEWQLRVAAGESLPAAQEELSLAGHAFEARLYAEDVPKGFLPATGKLTHLLFPDHARVDSGVRAGDAVSPFYDPMIAKIVVHARTRQAALGRLRRALSDTEVAGLVTNLAFLRRLADQADFVAGDVDTGLIERDLETLAAPSVPDAGTKALAAVAAMGLDAAGPLAGFTLWAPLRQSVTLLRDGAAETFEAVVRAPGDFEVSVDGAVQTVGRRGRAWWVNGQKTRARVAAQGNTITVFRGDGFGFTRADPLARGGTGAAAGDAVEAPMPGLVKALYVRAGESVASGTRVAVLEAMKMEHTLRAARDGVVAELRVAEGAQVEAGAVLIVLGEP